VIARALPYGRMAAFGVAFGFVLGGAGFGDYGELRRMFLLQDLRLVATWLGGAALAGVGFALFRGRGPALPRRPIHAGTVPGGLLFGAGWALSGACPGVVLVQLGEGRWAALATAAGIAAGTWGCMRLQERLRLDPGSCG
jgi:uncharacterized membrane protein YedE/YeeE